jgi:signal transduction histidine kinase/ligand-binding sensor protein
MGASGLDLSDIVEPSFLQAMLDDFSERTTLASAILDERSNPVTFELHQCEFCQEIRKTKPGLARCRKSDLHGIALAKKRKKLQFYICESGLVDFCGPIMLRKRILAYFFGGQFRCAYAGLKSPSEPSIADLVPSASHETSDFSLKTLCRLFRGTRVVQSEAELREIRRQAEALLDQINSIVQKLHDWHSAESVHEFMAEAARVRTVDELLDLTVRRLPDLMAAKACSVFTVQHVKDVGEDRLVLRKTTYAPLQPQENSAWYAKGEGLTGWVWRTGRSLRIVDLNDKGEISQYEGLEWKRKYDDSEEHRSFLAVPMVRRPGNEVIGVIRLPKKRRGLSFNFHDEIFLNFLAGQLAWALQCRMLEEGLELALGPASLASAATQFAGGLSYEKVLDLALASSMTLFGEKGKRHFVNMLEPDGQHWRIERAGGQLPMQEEFARRVFGLDEGVTGRLLRTKEFYISHDLKESLARGEYVAAVEHGASVIAVPMRYGDEVCGAIAIVSDRTYAFIADRDLGILENLGMLAGAAIRNSRMKEAAMAERERAYEMFARASLHFLRSRNTEIEGWISHLQRLSEKQGRDEIAAAVQSLQEADEKLKRIFASFEAVASLFNRAARPRVEDLNSIVKEAIGKRESRDLVRRLADQELPVLVDRFAIEQSILELLENAGRYIPTEGGRVTLETRTVMSRDGTAECWLIVEDNGPGIERGDKETVFEDTYTTDDKGGHTGLGLFIVKSIAELHRGRVWEEGTYGKGARFVLALPRRESGEGQ